jgi:hypothetical protein
MTYTSDSTGVAFVQGQLAAPIRPTSAVKRGENLLKICDQTRLESVEILRV